MPFGLRINTYNLADHHVFVHRAPLVYHGQRTIESFCNDESVLSNDNGPDRLR